MANYDFSTLNSTDLEELVCDLLNANRPLQSEVYYRTFKEGKDRGIDILYSSPKKDYDHVGQVKHYYKTGYKGLYYKLKKEEIQKVKKLNPNKYILATTVDLSIVEAEKIKKLFTPYINDLNDIYGYKDLNRLLEIHEHILHNHYKLWFSDTTILTKLLKSGFEFRSSAFIESEFKRRLRLYVKTPLFEKARASLKENKFIIITGEPGVGKTTLAEMLTYEYILDDYKLTYIYDDIKEADQALTPTDEKQIIYFDDFLGSNAVEINRAKGSETSLRKVLRRIQSQTNKLMIFTTRTFLLNSAIEESENLKRFNIIAKASILDLSEYTFSMKKMLMTNHIENSDLNPDQKDILRIKDVEEFILYHENYTPRSIEYITNAEVIKDLNPKEYKHFIFESFNSPVDIWAHAYSIQINEDERMLLNTLFSFGSDAKLAELDKAFHFRLDYEVLKNNKSKKIHTFFKSIQRLNGGFIHVYKDVVYFINPSLIDFLVVYLKNDKDEVNRIVESVCFASQLTNRFFKLSSLENSVIPQSLEKRLLEDYYSFVSEEKDFDLINLALVIHKNIKNAIAEDIVCVILKKIKRWNSLSKDYSLNLYFGEFMASVNASKKINGVIKDRMDDILWDLIVGKHEIHEAINKLENVLNEFNIHLAQYKTNKIEGYFSDLLEKYIKWEIYWLKMRIADVNEAYYKKNEVSELLNRLSNCGLSINVNLNIFNEINWIDLSLANDVRRQIEKDD